MITNVSVWAFPEIPFCPFGGPPGWYNRMVGDNYRPYRYPPVMQPYYYPPAYPLLQQPAAPLNPYRLNIEPGTSPPGPLEK